MAKQLDPRMIDPSKPLLITELAITDLSANKITTPSGTSDNWNDLYTFVQDTSAEWEESDEIISSVTNYLSTELVTISSLNVTNELLIDGGSIFNTFLTPDNTLTTSICAISADGVTPFVMEFTNGLLTDITF